MKPHRFLPWTLLSLFSLSIGSAAAGTSNADADTPISRYYHTKTPYHPQQKLSSYEAAPSAYHPVFTQMLARHGSRGLTGMKADLALYNMWLQASKEKALTALGAELGPDILQLMRANFLLGYGVADIHKPGYGNESALGIEEHTQLAARLHQRLPALFSDIGAAANSVPRKIVVQTSGKDRAVDSGFIFVHSLLALQANLAPLMLYPSSSAPRNEQKNARAAGTDRFMLYFHKLSEQSDQVLDPTDPLYPTYQASKAYQAYLNGAELQAKERVISRTPLLKIASRIVLERLFKPAFLHNLERGKYHFVNTGSHTFSSDDGKFSSTLSGDGDSRIGNSTDAARMLYELYGAAANMPAEVPSDFNRYMPAAQAQVFASVLDAEDFYRKGPGIKEQGTVTYQMAQLLRDDFFNEVDAIVKGDLAHAAKLRFAHAEIIIPLASIMGVKSMSEPLPRRSMYRYKNSPWRAELVAPMAANMQWDVYSNGQGGTLLRMLYNERETDFKAACDDAKIAPKSHFYDYAGLRDCMIKLQ